MKDDQAGAARHSQLAYSIMSGALSGSLTALLFQPFDFVKTRLQQPIDSSQSTQTLSAKSRQIRTVIERVLKTNPNDPACHRRSLLNLTRMWSGLHPALVRSVPVASIYFGTIEYTKSAPMLNTPYWQSHPILVSFIVGTVSKLASDLITYPLNLIKTRYESDMYSYRSMTSAFTQISTGEGGMRGLYKGLGITLIRDISYSGIYFTSYTALKKRYVAEHHTDKALRYAACALTGGLLASIVSQPTDIVRSYMQLEPAKYGSLFVAAKHVYVTRGLGGFAAGFWPRCIRRTLISVLSWTIYEKFSIKL